MVVDQRASPLKSAVILWNVVIYDKKTIFAEMIETIEEMKSRKIDRLCVCKTIGYPKKQTEDINT